jgi:DNA-cytosine methyltransferase
MQIIDLFSGIGGFSLAGSWMDWRTIQFCENNEFCKSKLKKHWPNVPVHDDIKTLTAQQIFNNNLYDSKETTIITGGFPCQPFSVAGKQKGKGDDRHLWPEMFRVIREVRPAWIVGENVPGITQMVEYDIPLEVDDKKYSETERNSGSIAVGETRRRIGRGILDEIMGQLEDIGYEVQPFIIPSASIGAWDKRDRVWIIAHNNQFRCDNEQKRSNETLQNEVGIGQIEKQVRREQQCGIGESNIITSDTNSKGLQGRDQLQKPIRFVQGIKKEYNIRCNCTGFDGINKNTSSIGRENSIYGKQQEGETDKFYNGFKGNDWWKRDWIEVASELCRSNARVSSELDEVIKIYEYGNENSNYQETISKIDLFRREILRDMWCEKHKIKQASFKTRPECFNDIMYAMPYQYTHERWNVGQRIEKDKKLCNMWNRILSSSFEETQDLQRKMFERIREAERNEKTGQNRTNRIKALGNSVNPYVVYQIFKAIEQFNSQA